MELVHFGEGWDLDGENRGSKSYHIQSACCSLKETFIADSRPSTIFKTDKA